MTTPTQSQLPEWAWIAACRLAGIDPHVQPEKILLVGLCLSQPGHQVVVAVDKGDPWNIDSKLSVMTCPLCGWVGLRVAR